jgi:PAS domain S-box-containing protein
VTCENRPKTRILLVEDEIIVAMGIEGWLVDSGYTVIATVLSGEEAIEAAIELEPDMVLMDISLRGQIDGITAAREIKAHFVDMPIVYMTAHTDEETLQRAKITAPLGYVHKPVEPRELRSCIEVALYKHALDCRLKESEALYRAIALLNSDYAYSNRVEPDNTVSGEWATEAYSRITGFSIEETAAHGGWISLVHPDDITQYHRHLQHLLLGERHSIEYRIINRTGQVRWLRVNSVPVWDERQQRVVRIYGAAEDVSERRQAEEALYQRHRELELLYRAGQAFNSTHDLDQMLATILEEVRSLLSITACSAWLLDAENGELVCRQVTDPQAQFVRGWRLAQGQGLAGWVAQNGQGLIVPDTRQDQRHYKAVDEQTGLPLRSIMTVPLRISPDQKHVGVQVIGVIQVVDTVVNRFTSNDLRLLESLAATVAIAVENARLYEQVHQDAETKAVLLREINHRTKNNLAAIIGLLSVERRYVGSENRAAYEAIRQKLVSRIQGLAAVHSLLSNSGWTALQLEELVHKIFQLAFQSLPAGRSAQFKVSPSRIRVTPDQAHNLALILNELATNALKYAWQPDNTPLQVTVSIARIENTIELEFRDNGPGYPSGILALDPAQHNVGFELIQNIVRRNLRGTLFLRNDRGAVTTIRFKAEIEAQEKTPGPAGLRQE